ncbi:hypothetical protein Ciccas_013209 [Cichlidogyrus casuarinus]|uniref:BTB domain-containing protein n=1 Tax=Cichlidogyrus casuarinus TaxID=1844966 RepID=A0ABD2PP93_9PLAT
MLSMSRDCDVEVSVFGKNKSFDVQLSIFKACSRKISKLVQDKSIELPSECHPDEVEKVSQFVYPGSK